MPLLIASKEALFAAVEFHATGPRLPVSSQLEQPSQWALRRTRECALRFRCGACVVRWRSIRPRVLASSSAAKAETGTRFRCVGFGASKPGLNRFRLV